MTREVLIISEPEDYRKRDILNDNQENENQDSFSLLDHEGFEFY